MSASHNPGGPDYDWGIKVKFNQSFSCLLIIIYLFSSIYLLLLLVYSSITAAGSPHLSLLPTKFMETPSRFVLSPISLDKIQVMIQ